MAASRTGTSRYLRNRQRVLREAQERGQTRCPHCGVTLDYHEGRKPNSAEADHIIAWANGGSDDAEQLTVICRHCNQSKGNRTTPKAGRRSMHRPLTTSRDWFNKG